MTRDSLEKLRIRSEWMWRWLYRRRGLLLRTLLCWTIGCMALTADESTTFDQRFNLRGEQKASKDVVVLTLYPSDFLHAYDVRTNSLTNIGDITDFTDSFFWERQTWKRLLTRVLADGPRAVGVALWFGDNIGEIRLSPEERTVLQDPRVYWSTSINNMERMLTPSFAREDLSNIGSSDLRRDEDGVVRRIFPTPDRVEVHHMVEKLAGKPLPSRQAGLVINYRGSPRLFPHYTLGDIFNDEIPADAFKDKIVVIGAESGSSPRFLTPMGPLSRAEILAQVLDNHLENRWIQRLPFGAYAAGLLLLTILAVFLITTYPQSVVLLFFLWIGTLWAALSAWIFDSFSIWIPAFSPFVLLAATWIIFIGYQATRIERLNAKLQQEQRYLQELEQLKNNFVSLISHDLKTPIAKIQAVLSRLMTQHPDPALAKDLHSLLDSSEELNKYIQSILKVLRVESRDFKVNREVADINEVIEEALAQLRPLAAERQIAIRSELEPMFSSEFDVTLIKEVLVNLIENAIKYTPAGGSIFIRSTEADEQIRVEIKDTGQGISREEIDKVWQKFVRGKDQDLKTKGTGLGLYLVKYFIELHGGRVSLDSEVGKGSTVSFTLPLVDDTTASPHEVTA